MGTTAFDRATEVKHEEANRYSALIPDDWNAPLLPHGGVGIATALRAAEAALSEPSQTLRTVTGVFAGQVHPGPAHVEVKVLRRGRSLSQVAVDLRNTDAEAGQHVVAVYGAPRPGFEFTDLEMPQALSVEDSRPFEPPPDADEFPANFWEHVDGRVALGNFWLDTGWEPNGRSDRGYWYRYHEAPRRDDGSLDPLALVALCDTMPGAVFQRMGPDAPDAFCPSADLTVHVLQASVSEWVLAHNIARHVGDGYASLEQRLWDPEVGLVAVGTQISFFSFPAGPPEDVRPPR